MQHLLAFIALVGSPAGAASAYNEPPPEIREVMRAPSPAIPSVSPTRDKLFLIDQQDYPTIERVAAPYLRLAGVRIEPKNHARHDTPGGYGIPPCVRGLELVNIADGAQTPVALSKLTCVDRPNWSPDGKHFFITDRASSAVELWLGDSATGRITKIPKVRINPMFGYEAQWLSDKKSLLVKLVPKDLPAPPRESAAPTGPIIQETKGEKGQSSTYEKRDTLNNKYDEELFNYYGRSQLAVIDVAHGKITPLGPPGIYGGVLPAPDAKHVLVYQITKPYSYVTAYERFPRQYEVWDIADAHHITRTPLAKLPLADRVPVHGVRTGPRDFKWRANAPATLVWGEALDGGDWNAKVRFRDKLMTLSAPFTAAPAEMLQLEQRYSGMEWIEGTDLALIDESNENTHWERTFLVHVDDPKPIPRLLFDHSSDEQYLDPGQPVRKALPSGFGVVRQSQNAIYLSGDGASEAGDRPFLDRLDLTSFKTERIFRSDKTVFERFLQFPGADETKFMTWHQSPEAVPNAFVRTLGPAVKAPDKEAAFESSAVALTHLPDPTPQVRQIKKRLVRYKRADGLDLSFTLYTPIGYREGTRVPTILYAYPRDYADASKAAQVTGSQATYTRLRNYRLLLLAGYAIIDDAAFPVVGNPKTAYDNYLDQLTQDAKAAVDEAVRLGVADPDRIGVTGHSHGALMTVNLLAHTNLFRAGVATSGSYNKTLTPFGFQSERRSVWQAGDVYRKVSPFFAVDKIKVPLLIMHGEEDANPGTTPMQASFLFDAIRGNGGIARLVMLPHEPHWYSALESNEQMIYEMVTWFDRYVKAAPPNTPTR